MSTSKINKLTKHRLNFDSGQFLTKCRVIKFPRVPKSDAWDPWTSHLPGIQMTCKNEKIYGETSVPLVTIHEDGTCTYEEITTIGSQAILSVKKSEKHKDDVQSLLNIKENSPDRINLYSLNSYRKYSRFSSNISRVDGKSFSKTPGRKPFTNTYKEISSSFSRVGLETNYKSLEKSPLLQCCKPSVSPSRSPVSEEVSVERTCPTLPPEAFYGNVPVTSIPETIDVWISLLPKKNTFTEDQESTSHRSHWDKDWWMDCYAEDIHSNLLLRESLRPSFHMQSSQLHLRFFLVGYISAVCESLNLCKQVKFLAVYILDYFMDDRNLELETVQVVLLVCVLLAAKMEEGESAVPKLSELTGLTANRFSTRNFAAKEITLLQLFGANLLIDTPITFSSYYSLHAISDSDVYCGSFIEGLKEKCMVLIDTYIEVCLLYACFRQIRSSTLAASCVLIARISLFVEPVWTPYLERFTSFYVHDLVECVKLLTFALTIQDFITSEQAVRITGVVKLESERNRKYYEDTIIKA